MWVQLFGSQVNILPVLLVVIVTAREWSVFACNQQRHVFTNQTGVITDGPGRYGSHLSCEWLIKGKALLCPEIV